MKLAPRDVRREWDRIKGPLTTVLEGQDERPEDVYADCVNGDASLYMAEEGFLVLRKAGNRFSGVDELVVWVAASFVNGHDSVIEKYVGDVTEIGRKAGCGRIVFRAKRRGFERALPEGWKATLVTYELEIPHG